MSWRKLWATCLLAVVWLPANAQKVTYIHTDALGSVVAVTDQNRNVIERREYEPYGQQLTPAVQDGPGYTGHVQDAATGLVYMQQRYYDPVIGRVLSMDPITAYSTGDVRYFNGYAYAFNNPYKFTDPDGRCPNCALDPNAIARMAPAGRVQTANGQAQQVLGQAVRGVAQQVAQDVNSGRGTLQVGLTVNGTSGPLATTATAGVAIDRQGNVALYHESGGGPGAGGDVAASVSAKLTNAETINDLAGRSINISAGGGKGAHGAADVSIGTARDGSAVYGAGATIGAGAGGGGSATVTNTVVIPVKQPDKEIPNR